MAEGRDLLVVDDARGAFAELVGYFHPVARPPAGIHPHAAVYDGCEVGERCELHAGAVIGADGFGYAGGDAAPRKVPQVGRVVLAADVEVGAAALARLGGFLRRLAAVEKRLGIEREEE